MNLLNQVKVQAAIERANARGISCQKIVDALEEKAYGMEICNAIDALGKKKETPKPAPAPDPAKAEAPPPARGKRGRG